MPQPTLELSPPEDLISVILAPKYFTHKDEITLLFTEEMYYFFQKKREVSFGSSRR